MYQPNSFTEQIELEFDDVENDQLYQVEAEVQLAIEAHDDGVFVSDEWLHVDDVVKFRVYQDNQQVIIQCLDPRLVDSMYSQVEEYAVDAYRGVLENG